MVYAQYTACLQCTYVHIENLKFIQIHAVAECHYAVSDDKALVGAPLIAGLEYGMECWTGLWNGKWNGTANVHNYS